MAKTKTEICDRCKKEFKKKWSSRQNDWSQINDIHYWTEGKDWKGYKILCRPCLNYWFEEEGDSFHELVSRKKLPTFYSYRANGTL